VFLVLQLIVNIYQVRLFLCKPLHNAHFTLTDSTVISGDAFYWYVYPTSRRVRQCELGVSENAAERTERSFFMTAVGGQDLCVLLLCQCIAWAAVK